MEGEAMLNVGKITANIGRSGKGAVRKVATRAQGAAMGAAAAAKKRFQAIFIRIQ